MSIGFGKHCLEGFRKVNHDLIGISSQNMIVQPTISVVTPSFNQAKYLEATLRSVLDQDYPNVEHIVMDGGSTDGSLEILRKYGSKLAYWCSEKDKGQADALARGFQRCTGDILCWLNSDDVFLPGALTKVARYFSRNPDVEAACGGAYIIDSQGSPVKRFGHCTLGVSATFDRFRFYGQDGVYQPATFWRRTAYDAVGGVDPNLQFIMDRDLFTRLASRMPFGRLPSLLACFRLHDEGKTCRIPEIQQRESTAFFSRYGQDACSTVGFAWRYWRHRIPSLVRKAHIHLLVRTGSLQLPAV